ncbi:putative glycosyl transferase [Talaromyces proteolyticus]|uniref:Glycosyl transferase n=1 Tax=Talaromyces proteolyticus TaxID=1131652 RepID=A0AAD4L299_9EURO|nr:putative glycosyl transferase [Talaromyces proteolyticus]KAH8702525.1 putative glycosyl transferase [Talaromyces proteolyticus]
MRSLFTSTAGAGTRTGPMADPKVPLIVRSDEFPAALKGKRILLATESLGPVNGVSRTTSMLIEYLRANGVELAIVAPRYEQKGRRQFVSSSAPTAPSHSRSESEVRLHGYPLPYNPDLTVVYPFRFDRVCQRTFQPDIVYLASPASVGYQFLWQIRQLREPPVVLLNYQTDLAAYSSILLPGAMGRFGTWLVNRVQGFLFNHPSVDTIFYPCSDVRSYLEEAGAPSNRLVQLGRGVDTVLFNPRHRDEAYRRELAPNGEIILAYTCRLAPEKGFDFLAELAIRLVKEGLPYKLLIVGGNRNPAVEADVQNLFDPVRDNVIFTGFLGGDSLARAYAAADIFLHCSITETFGLVVLESMASGVPVIARDQGGPSDIVKDGKTGYLVAPDDLDEFARLTLRLARDSDLRKNLAIAARAFADETTWEKINCRVAWHLVQGMETHKKRLQLRRAQRPIRNWLATRYREFEVFILWPLIEQLRVNAAIGFVFFMWMIAVIPLILHGSRLFNFLYTIPLTFQKAQTSRLLR